MCKLNKKSGNKRIDPCMNNLIRILNEKGIRTRACCCGHGKYNMTIVVFEGDLKVYREIMSNIIIPRKKRFYKKDKNGRYYIPECIK